MDKIKALYDEYGVIHDAARILPENTLKVKFVEALAELEDNNCHTTLSFPKTRLHKVKGIKESVYRADVDKISGWRIHAMYENNVLHLKDIIPGNKHDDVLKVIKSKKYRYTRGK